MHVRKRVKSQEELLQLSEWLLSRKKHDKHKLYRCHAPEGECISKGKAHKKYECGCKVSVEAASCDNCIAGIEAHHGNPYDRHTLTDVLTQMQRLAESPEMIPINTIFVAVIPVLEIRRSILHGTNEDFQSPAR